MNRLDKQNLINILKPFKDKIDNLSSGDNTDLDEFKSEVATQLNNKLSLTGGSLMGPLSIINDKTNIVLSAQEKSARLAIGSNHLDLTDEGKLKVNDKSVLMDGDVVSSSGNIEVKLPDDLIKITTTSTGPSTTKTANECTGLNNIPYRYEGARTTSIIGTNVYLFGSDDSTYTKTAYKYSISNNSYTQIANTPDVVGGNCGITACLGNSYIFGGSRVHTGAYKYDHTTNTYTSLTKIPTSIDGGYAIDTGTNIIYLFGLGTGSSGEYYKVYKYDVSTGTYSLFGDIYNQETIENGCAAKINDKIYIFGGSSNNKGYYKLDTSLGTIGSFVSLSDSTRVWMPFECNCSSAVAVGNYAYILGGYSNEKNVYKFDPSTNTFTSLTNLTSPFVHGACVVYNNMIYLFGSSYSSSAAYAYKYNPVPTTITIPGTTTSSTYTAMLKPSGHSIYTASKSYTSSSAQLVAINASDYYTEYDENNNVIKNTSAISSTGTTKLYVKSGGKLHGKDLPSSTGWQTIDLLKYI